MASQGPLAPTVATDDAGVGSLSWINVNDIFTSNDVRASVSTIASGTFSSHYLFATGFGFTIPGAATIDGVQFDVECQANNTNASDGPVQMVDAGSPVGADFGTYAPPSIGSDGVLTYGGPTTIPDGGSWTPAQINDVGFGLSIVVGFFGTPGIKTFSVDQVLTTVYYTVAGAPATARAGVFSPDLNSQSWF